LGGKSLLPSGVQALFEEELLLKKGKNSGDSGTLLETTIKEFPTFEAPKKGELKESKKRLRRAGDFLT